jgi:glycosyltransferase involved in cell wall biosynthesis
MPCDETESRIFRGAGEELALEICIPVLNEAETLERQVSRLVAAAHLGVEIPRHTRFVIADNGSADGTRELSQAIASTTDVVRVVGTNRPGVGLALREAWLSSNADIVGYMDLDLATDLKHVREAIGKMNIGMCFVNGSRWMPDSVVAGRSRLRTFTSWSFNGILRAYVGTKVTDGMCGFKFLDRSLVQGLVDRGACSDGWFFATEIAVLAAEDTSITYTEIPVTWSDDPNSKVRVARLVVEYLRGMHNLKKRLRNGT